MNTNAILGQGNHFLIFPQFFHIVCFWQYYMLKMVYKLLLATFTICWEVLSLHIVDVLVNFFVPIAHVEFLWKDLVDPVG